MKRIVTIVLLFLSLFLLTNCDKNPVLKLQKEIQGNVGDKTTLNLEIANIIGGENFEWKTSDPTVVSLVISADYLTVEVTLLKVGEADITVAIIGTEIKATCKVIVSDALNVPEIKIENNKVVWTSVENAQSYLVMIGEQTYSTDKCEYDLTTITLTEDISIAVKAIAGDSLYSDSQYSNTVIYYANLEKTTEEYTKKFLKMENDSWTPEMTEEDFSDINDFYLYSSASERASIFAKLAINRNDNEATVDKGIQIYAILSKSDGPSEILKTITDDFFANKEQLASAIDLFIDMIIHLNESSFDSEKVDLLQISDEVTFEDCLAVANILHSLFNAYKGAETIVNDEENAILLQGEYEKGNTKYVTIKNDVVDAILNNLPEVSDLIKISATTGRVFKIVYEYILASNPEEFIVAYASSLSQLMTQLEENPQIVVQNVTTVRVALNYLKTLDINDLDKIFPYLEDRLMLLGAGVYFAIDAIEYFENDATIKAMVAAQGTLTEEEMKASIKQMVSVVSLSIASQLEIPDTLIDSIYQLTTIDTKVFDTVKTMLYEDKEELYNSIIIVNTDVKPFIDIIFDYPYAIVNSIDENNIEKLADVVKAICEVAKPVLENENMKIILESILYDDAFVEDIAKFALKLVKTLTQEIVNEDFKKAVASFINANGIETNQLPLSKEIAKSLNVILSSDNIIEAEALFNRFMNHIPEDSRIDFPRTEIESFKEILTVCSNVDLNNPTEEERAYLTGLLELLGLNVQNSTTPYLN